jgi:hypothetical protein
VIASVAMSAGGCGGQEQAPHVAKASGAGEAKTEGPGSQAATPYLEVLLEFRDAAQAGRPYDAYGFAEYLSDSQRAAIDAFCLVVDRVRTAPEGRRLSGPAYFTSQVLSAARPEARAASMASVRRAVTTLRGVVEPRSLDSSLVKNYAGACY